MCRSYWQAFKYIITTVSVACPMMTHPAAARLNYLNDAAHLLALRSPATAAFLQARIDGLAAGFIALEAAPDPFRAHQKSAHKVSALPLPKTRHIDICTSCGYMLSLQPLRLEMHGSREKNNVQQSSIQSTKRLYIECSECGAKTYQTVVQPDRVKKHSKKESPAAQDKVFPISGNTLRPKLQDSIATKPASTSSRKRTRKGNTLSAMLAKSKQDAASSNNAFGLDLMDLMKST
jgi:hypothetical protein